MALDFRNSCLKNFNELLIYNLRQRNCNINMVKKLLAHKVDVNYKDCFLNTSLHYVVQNFSDKLDLIREILNMEGNPNAVNAEGNSPLHLAVLKSNVHVILELIKFGGEVRLANKRGNTPLHVAAMRGKPCIIEILLKSDSSLINCGNIRGNSPLHIAVIHGKSVAAEMLIRHKANINCNNIDGNTPLHMTIIHDKEDLAKTLIQSGADLNCVNKECNTPLHLSAVHGKLNIMRTLLTCGADVDCVNLEGNTPLHLAATRDNYDAVDVLIEFNVDVACSNNEFITPMHIAAINGSSKIVRRLNFHGAPVDCVDAKGNTPLHLAVSHNQPVVIECLVVIGAEHVCNKDGYAPLHFAAIEGNLDMIRVLLIYGADIDCRDDELNTPLHLAIIYDKPLVVIKLIEEGAKTDLLNLDSHTPVQLAALHGNVNMINVLFQNGVRVKLRNQGRRYISSFAQSLIQHSNPAAQTGTGNNAQTGATGGVAGTTQSATQNNTTASSGSQPSSAVPMTFLATLSSNPNFPSSGITTSTTSGASIVAGESIIQQLMSLPPISGHALPIIATTGASFQPATVASTSHASNTSSVSSQTSQGAVPTSQGSNESSNQAQSAAPTPVPENLIPVVAQTISQIANSLGTMGGLLPPAPTPGTPFAGTGISPANSFADLFFETDQAYVLGPLADPPTFSEVSAWSLAQSNQNHGAEAGAGSNVPQQAQSTYVSFLDELDAEGDPMSWSWSPFLRNSRVEETAIIDSLVKFYGINGRNRTGNECLQRALVTDDPEDIAALLQAGTVNSTKCTRRQNSFLHLAAVHGKPNLVKALIDSGVTIDFRNNEMNTALHFAAFCGEAAVIDILIQAGASMDTLNRRGASALKYAFGYCREGVIKTLGKVGARRFLFAAKTLVKYDVLKKGLYLTRHKVLKANCIIELLRFVDVCCNEVLRMKQKHLGKNFSFYQFVNQALSSAERLSASPYVEPAVEYLLEISSKTEYPVYKKIFISLIVPKLEKSFWQEKLLDLVDNAVEEGKISLNRKLFASICNYISNVDIFNLLLAFTDTKLKN